MHYEEGLSYLSLASHLSPENPERNAALNKAREAFKRGGLDHRVEVTNEQQAGKFPRLWGSPPHRW
jgi:hypothetical protein